MAPGKRTPPDTLDPRGGRSFPLDAVRADGWFERIAGSSGAFAQLCNIVGERFVAFSIVAGLRVTALQVDGRNPERSAIEFTVGETGPAQRMTLADFRRRLANALVAEDEARKVLPADPTDEDLQAVIGIRSILLAPVFGIALHRLHEQDELEVEVTIDEAPLKLSLDALRETLRERIRAEAERYRSPAPFAIDLSILPDVEAAAIAGNHPKVLAMLGSWPGPLSMLLRTPEGRAVTDEARKQIVAALGFLGTAYAALDRIEWAEDVLRLGIQWGGEGNAAADLYRRLGETYLDHDRPGEAIGLLRRALALGGERRLVLSGLARAFAQRGRHVAAIACLEGALAEGADASSVTGLREEALGALGPTWQRFRDYLST